jgi:hypothetical protein
MGKWSVVILSLGILFHSVVPSSAICILGMGSCLPDERAALEFVNQKLASAELPAFPIVNQIAMNQAVVWNCGGTREGFSGWGQDPDVQAADEAAWKSVQVRLEAMKKGSACQDIMFPREVITPSPTSRTSDGRLCSIVVTIPYTGVIQSDPKPCAIMQTLHSKGLVELTVKRHQALRAHFTIEASETQAMAAMKKGKGIPVAKFGPAKAEKNYSQTVMGTNMAVVEFSAPIAENEFAAECRKIGLPCGNVGTLATGSVKFLSRSDGWALDPSTFSWSRR